MKYLVIDSPFNRANYPQLIGLKLNSPPAYAEVREIQPTIEDEVHAHS
jgi:hypothetical protein